MFKDILNYSLLGNEIIQYGMALSFFIGGVIAIKILEAVVLIRIKKWAKKTEAFIDDILIRNIEKSAIPLLFLGILYYSIHAYLKLSPRTERAVYTIAVGVGAFLLVRTASSLIRRAIEKYWEKKHPAEAEGERRSIRGISSFINLIVWVIGIIFTLDNLGFQISAVVAGLGIGGVAVALAAQTILGDLFNYFVILFDQPFKVGDFIVIDTKMGFVDKIGIKTTRIHSLTGEQLIFSNTDLTNSRIHNYQKMEKRRIEFKFGVIYQTEPETLEKIPVVLKEIIESIPDAEFDRAHFYNFGDSSLDFRAVYFIKNSEYISYMNTQQTINLALIRAFRDMGVDFAYPTRTIFIEK